MSTWRANPTSQANGALGHTHATVQARWPRALQRMVLTVLWLGWPLAPVACALLSGQLRHLRHYPSSLARCARMLRAMQRADVIARNAQRSWRGPRSEQIEGQCTHCGNCCVHHSCVFLDMDTSGHSSCSIYGNWFFKRLACAAYPVDARDIAVYSCPSFYARVGGQPARAVIPIKPLN